MLWPLLMQTDDPVNMDKNPLLPLLVSILNASVGVWLGSLLEVQGVSKTNQGLDYLHIVSLSP